MAAGGFKMSLGGLKAKPGLKSAIAQNTAKPKKALLGDDEPDDTNKAQEIAGFDAAEGGAIDVNGPTEKKGPLVIPSLPNRNWREEARKKQLERAPHTKQRDGDVVMEEEEKEVVYGLTVPTKPAEGANESGQAEPEAMEVDVKDNLTDAQRLDKAALEHLLNGQTTDTARIVPAITDEQALANDLHDAPDEPSLDAYEATPIEGFGLAMLRGMGWKDSDGESRSKNGTPAKPPKEIKRRPALLGIGAKEDAAKDVELGEFNSKARKTKKDRIKDKDAPTGYTPVTLRNKKTGEVISEEDLKRKLASQDIVPDEAPTESRRRDEESGSERRRERRGDADADRHRDRDRQRRRDRNDDDSDTRRERRRYRDKDRHRDDDHDDYDSSRRSEKRRRDRSRSPRDDRRRDRDRDRYRSRSRSRSRDAKERRSRRDRSRDDEERRRRRREKEKEREGERDGRRRVGIDNDNDNDNDRDRDRDRDRGERSERSERR